MVTNSLVWLKIACITVLLFMFSLANAVEKRQQITLAGPMASVSNPLMRMVSSGALTDITDSLKFELWRTPDQMRAMSLNGNVDFIATPTNVAANLYNRGADIRLLNVSVWGILWMVSRDNSLKTIADFKDKEIAMPFRGDMPDIIFSTLAKSSGLNPKTDFNLRYVASPLDAMQLLIMRRVDHALLAEPAISMALRKTQSFPVKMIAPDLYRSANLQDEWGRLLKRQSSIPQAGMAVLNSALSSHEIKRFNDEYRKATQWCIDNPDEAGQLIGKTVKMLTPEAISDSIKVSQIRVVSATEAKSDLEHFFSMLHQETPALIGGTLPSNSFYYTE